MLQTFFAKSNYKGQTSQGFVSLKSCWVSSGRKDFTQTRDNGKKNSQRCGWGEGWGVPGVEGVAVQFPWNPSAIPKTGTSLLKVNLRKV